MSYRCRLRLCLSKRCATIATKLYPWWKRCVTSGTGSGYNKSSCVSSDRRCCYRCRRLPWLRSKALHLFNDPVDLLPYQCPRFVFISIGWHRPSSRDGCQVLEDASLLVPGTGWKHEWNNAKPLVTSLCTDLLSDEIITRLIVGQLIQCVEQLFAEHDNHDISSLNIRPDTDRVIRIIKPFNRENGEILWTILARQCFECNTATFYHLCVSAVSKNRYRCMHISSQVGLWNEWKHVVYWLAW